MFHMSNSFFRQKLGSMDAGDIFRNNPQLAKQFAAAAASQAGPGFGNFMGAAMGVPQMPQSQGMPQMQPQGPGAFYNAPNSMGTPQMPQNMAAAAAPPVHRREMKGPSGVDDIMRTFQEVRSAELEMNPLSMPGPPPVFNQQPVKQALSEISSIHSQQDDDLLSQGESVRTGITGQRRGRRKAATPVENTISLNL